MLQQGKILCQETYAVLPVLVSRPDLLELFRRHIAVGNRDMRMVFRPLEALRASRLKHSSDCLLQPNKFGGCQRLNENNLFPEVSEIFKRLPEGWQLASPLPDDVH